jgi:lysyl-tRNA synthetase class 2
VRATGDALLWQVGPFDFHDELGHLDEAIAFSGALTVAWCAYLLFRPLAAPRALPGAEVRRAARKLVRRHGHDSLAYFKLRRDQHYLFSADGRAFLGYRVEAGVLIVSGDPVGEEADMPGLLKELSIFAESVACGWPRSARVSGYGRSGSSSACARFTSATRRWSTFAPLSLEGRPIRKVRQSVTRLEKQGYAADVRELP